MTECWLTVIWEETLHTKSAYSWFKTKNLIRRLKSNKCRQWRDSEVCPFIYFWLRMRKSHCRHAFCLKTTHKIENANNLLYVIACLTFLRSLMFRGCYLIKFQFYLFQEHELWVNDIQQWTNKSFFSRSIITEAILRRLTCLGSSAKSFWIRIMAVTS